MLHQAFKTLKPRTWVRLVLTQPQTFGGRTIPAGPVRLYQGNNFGFVAWRDATGAHLAHE